MKESPTAPMALSERHCYGDLGRDGFRVTRWDAGDEPPGRHWFDARALVLCLNIAGRARFHSGAGVAQAVEAGSALLGASSKGRSSLERSERGTHRFVALEMRRPWLSRWLPTAAHEIRPTVRHFLAGPGARESRCEVHAMTAPLAQIAADLLQPPAHPAAWVPWHHAKTLELVAQALLATGGEELFCERTKRAGRERVERVREVLLADLEHPPALAELGRRVGCSPFYLSRIFRQETGETISAFLRNARLQRAAELLRGGGANVTEAAMTVGYSSLSHFSKAFAEAFGCCPCLYGRKSAGAPGVRENARGAA